MYKEFIEALKRRPLLEQMLSEMEEMLADAVEMYRPIAEALRGEEELREKARQCVYDTDQRINHLQRKIRKQLVEHLIMSPGTDVPVSLVLMSITKDAERVGDLCKNLVEVAEAMDAPITEWKHGGRLETLLAGVEALFEPTVLAFSQSDKELGQAAIEAARTRARECDELIDGILGDELPTREAVLTALLTRYLKRISLHLSNIATSVVMPLHRIDYFDEEGGSGK